MRDTKCKNCESGCEKCDARFLRDYYIRYNNTELLQLSNICFLVNDFNFFDLIADYTPADGRKRRGKFHLSELEGKKRVMDIVYDRNLSVISSVRVDGKEVPYTKDGDIVTIN